MKRFSSALGSMSVKLNSWSERSAHWMSEPCAAAASWMVLWLRLHRRVLSGDGGGFIRDAVVRHNTMPSVLAGAFFFLKNGAVLTEAAFVFHFSSSPAGGFGDLFVAG